MPDFGNVILVVSTSIKSTKQSISESVNKRYNTKFKLNHCVSLLFLMFCFVAGVFNVL